MKILLFNRNEQYIATLRGVLSAKHTEELNGENVLEIETLDEIEKNQRLIYKDKYGYWHEFIVRGVEEERAEEGIIRKVFAEHSFYETWGDYIEDKRPYDVTANIALENALEPTRWEVGQVDDLGINSTNFYHISAKEAVQKVAETWQGELRYRIGVSGNRITGRYVDLLARRGYDLGKRFTYTKDLISITKTVHRDDVITALYGYGKGQEIVDEEGQPTGGYGRRITFGEINGGKNYVENLEAKEIWGRLNPDGTRSHVFGKVEFDDIEDPYELLQLTQEKLEELSQPLVTYEAKVIDLKALGIEHEGVELGDWVGIVDKEFNPPLRLKARVIKIVRDLLEPENTEIVLGNFIPTITDSWLEQEKYISNFRDKQGVWDRSNIINDDGTIDAQYLNNLVAELNAKMNAQGGYVYISENGKGLITYDKPIDQNPTMAIQLLGGAFRIANSKLPNGEWNWRIFGDGNGFVADAFIGGLLKGGKVHFDLTNGTLLIGNSKEDYNLYFDGNNLSIKLSNNKLIETTLTELETGLQDYADQKTQEAVDNIQVGGRNLIPNSHISEVFTLDPQTATFTRSSIAYLTDGTQVAANVPRFEQGKFGKAIMVEEGTTNLWSKGNPETWEGYSISATLPDLYSAQIVEFQGRTCLKVHIASAGDGTQGWRGCYILHNFTTVTGDTYTQQCEMYVEPGGRFQGASIKPQLNGEHTLSGVYINYDLNQVGTWQKLIRTSTANADGEGNLNIYFFAANAGAVYDVDYTVYLYHPQIEKLPYPTSFIDGTRADETLTIPTAGVLNPQEGTVEFWVKPLVVANYNNFFNMQTSNGRFLLFFEAHSYHAYFDYGAINSGVKSSNNTITANNWHHIVLRWSATTGKQALFVNGVKYEQDLPNGVATSFPATVSIVKNYSAYIDDLRISSIARSDEEIAAAYASGQPLPVDQYTTYKMGFDDTLQPTGKHERLVNLEAGQKYTFSSQTSGNVQCSIYEPTLTHPGLSIPAADMPVQFIPDWTGEYKVAFSANESCSLKAKLEKGNKATDWTPAPEDVEAYAEHKAAEAEQAAKAHSDAQLSDHDANQSPHSLPSYVKMQGDGFKVFDGSNRLRAHLGQYLAGLFGLALYNIYGDRVFEADDDGNLKIVGDFVTYAGGQKALEMVGQILKVYDWEGTERVEPVGQLYSSRQDYDPAKPGVILANKKNAILALAYEEGDTFYNYVTFDKDNTTGQEEPIKFTGNIYVGDGYGLRIANTYLIGNVANGVNIKDTGGTTLAGFMFNHSSGWDIHFYRNTICTRNARVNGNFNVDGAKNALHQTEHYGERQISAYETAEYYFGDIGSGTINQDGECIVYIDDIFSECVNTDIEYHIFTQVYNGAITSIDRQKTYFTVYGTPETEFSWELKAKRRGYEYCRLEVPDNSPSVDVANFDDCICDNEVVVDMLEKEITYNLTDYLLS